MRPLLGLVVFAALSSVLVAQTSFEVASVKPNPNDVPEGISLSPSGEIRYTGFHLKTLIAMTYGTAQQTFDQFVGGPSWLDRERFDITAKAAGDISADAQGRRSERIAAMLRTLIEDRFKVKVHYETREAPVYILRLVRRDGKLGPQIHESTIECPRFVSGAPPPAVDPNRWCGIRAIGGTITGQGVPLSQIAGNLSGYPVVRRVVFDRTGLTGRYDFQIQYTPDAVDAASSTAPSLFTALTEQLGLTLQSDHAPLQYVVIDRAEHPAPD